MQSLEVCVFPGWNSPRDYSPKLLSVRALGFTDHLTPNTDHSSRSPEKRGIEIYSRPLEGVVFLTCLEITQPKIIPINGVVSRQPSQTVGSLQCGPCSVPAA